MATLTHRGNPVSVQSLADVQALAEVPLAQAVPWVSTYDMVSASCRKQGERIALTFLPTGELDDTPVRWSYATLLARLHQTANLLHNLGLGPQSVVGILLPGGLAYHLALWGGEAAATVQPLNPMLSDDTLAELLHASGAVALIAHGVDDATGMLAKAQRLQARLPGLKHLLRVVPDEAVPSGQALPAGTLDFWAALAGQPADRLISGRVFKPTDTAALFHTGGTTGSPKLARHSHFAQVFSAWANATMQGMRETDVLINGYPLFHVAGVLPGALCSLHVGMETIVPTASLFRNPVVVRNYWRLVERHRCTLMSGVPTVLAAVAAVPVGGADTSSLRSVRTGASPLPPELSARFQRELGLTVNESLGMTETAGLSAVAAVGQQAPAGCVGWPLPYCQVRIATLTAEGQTGPDAPAGTTGLVLYRGPNVFSGYLHAADTTSAFTPDGWLNTGDLGFVDERGRLHLNGRAKDLIIRSGHNIDPKVIEDALGAHPAVHLCAAVGAPDAYAGELPVAFASLRPGMHATEPELLAFAAERVNEAPARPKTVTIVANMPVTQVGKIFKPALRDLAALAVVQAHVRQVADAMATANAAPASTAANAVHSVHTSQVGATQAATPATDTVVNAVRAECVAEQGVRVWVGAGPLQAEWANRLHTAIDSLPWPVTWVLEPRPDA
jgi:fatty-acyl-CoA synthase